MNPFRTVADTNGNYAYINLSDISHIRPAIGLPGAPMKAKAAIYFKGNPSPLFVTMEVNNVESMLQGYYNNINS